MHLNDALSTMAPPKRAVMITEKLIAMIDGSFPYLASLMKSSPDDPVDQGVMAALLAAFELAAENRLDLEMFADPAMWGDACDVVDTALAKMPPEQLIEFLQGSYPGLAEAVELGDNPQFTGGLVIGWLAAAKISQAVDSEGLSLPAEPEAAQDSPDDSPEDDIDELLSDLGMLDQNHAYVNVSAVGGQQDGVDGTRWVDQAEWDRAEPERVAPALPDSYIGSVSAYDLVDAIRSFRLVKDYLVIENGRPCLLVPIRKLHEAFDLADLGPGAQMIYDPDTDAASFRIRL